MIMSRRHPLDQHNSFWHKTLTCILYVSAISLVCWHLGRDFAGDELLPIRWANFMAPWIIYSTMGLILFAVATKRYVPTTSLSCALIITVLGTPGLAENTVSQLGFVQITNNAVASNATPPSTRTPSISVISFNVGSFNRKYEEITTLIKGNPAEIIFLQEVAKPRILLEQLYKKNLLRRYNIHTDKTTGLVLLSLYAIKSANRLPGVLTRYKIAHHTGSISLWNTHVPRSIWSIKGQKKVIKNLADDVQRHPGPQIIAGDFNFTPYNDEFKKLVGNVNDQRSIKSRPFSYPTPAVKTGILGPWVQIDHIIVSSHFSTNTQTRLKNFAGSDHYPIAAQLRLRGNAYTGLGNGATGRPGEG